MFPRKRIRGRRHPAVAAIAMGAAAAMVLSACGSNGEDEGPGAGFEDCDEFPAECNSGPRQEGGEITWAMDASWGGYTEIHADGRSVYQQQAITPMYPRIGEFDPDGDFVLNDGVFAAEPELVAEDPLEVAYELNPEATWGDGTSISYDDFLYNWYAWSGDEEKCNEDCAPSSASWGPNVEDITEEDDGRIHVTYVDGYQNPEWMYQVVLSHPAHIAEEEGFDWQNDPDEMGESMLHFLTTAPTWSAGPYILDSFEDQDYLTYVPNPEWTGSEQPTLDSITLQVIEDVEAILTELRQGTVHGAATARYEPDIVDQLDTIEDVRYNIAPGPSFEFLMLNTQNPQLQDIELRRAILTAFDVPDINERTHGLVLDDVPAKMNYLFDEDSEYYTDVIGPTGFGTGDTEAARDILEDAGYTWDDSDNLLDSDGEQVTMEHRVMQGPSFLQTVGEMMQHYMDGLGIDVTLNSFPNSDLVSVHAAGEFDSSSLGWSSPPTFATQPSQLWRTGSGSNFGQMSVDEVDDLIDEIERTNDLDEAADYANRAMELVAEDAYMLPLNESPSLVVVSEDLINIRENWASSQRSMYNIAEWGLWDEEADE